MRDRKIKIIDEFVVYGIEDIEKLLLQWYKEEIVSELINSLPEDDHTTYIIYIVTPGTVKVTISSCSASLWYYSDEILFEYGVDFLDMEVYECSQSYAEGQEEVYIYYMRPFGILAYRTYYWQYESDDESLIDDTVHILVAASFTKPDLNGIRIDNRYKYRDKLLEKAKKMLLSKADKDAAQFELD